MSKFRGSDEAETRSDAGGCCTVLEESGGCCTVLEESGGCCTVLEESGGCCTVLEESGGCCTVLEESGGCCTVLEESGGCCTVLEGSGQTDVAYAKVFWSPLTLQPPIESGLVSEDIRQRLKVAKATPPRASEQVRKPPPWSKADEMLHKAYQLQMQDEKRRYLGMAKKRDEIMALLRKQREDRIKKEMISRVHKPSRPEEPERFPCKTDSEVLDQEIKEVRELV